MDISTISIMISIVSVSFAVFFGLKNNRRSDEKEIAPNIKLFSCNKNEKLISINTDGLTQLKDGIFFPEDFLLALL